ncbi:MAG TPA: phosphatase PAP2 family protein [Bryobacteraceae bacterium]|jgi:membrane-associated phospholipid phosphatase|nr:phosphatase PAP2 family protein [Bryobacteraceae bacterium]
MPGVFRKPHLRATEILFIAYFGYAAIVASFFGIPRCAWTWVIFGAAAAGFTLIASGFEHAFRYARDWIPLGVLLLAYREMDWFTRPERRTDLEALWRGWDVVLLRQWHLQAALESAGPLIPGILELCYLLIYAVGPSTVAVLYLTGRRQYIDRALLLTLGGTLLSYVFFPYFPTEPPRSLFATPAPEIHTALRHLNLWIVNNAGIGSSVFPSAHVSGAFSAAFALILNLPGKYKWKWSMLGYAIAVAIATVYGRYHYAVDAAAGLAVALTALFAALLLRNPKAAQ